MMSVIIVQDGLRVYCC